MIKKAFTLVELVIVMIILWILFLALWYLTWSYIFRLNVQNDQETINQTFFVIQSRSLSQPVFQWKALSYIWIRLVPDNNNISIVWYTWNKDNFIVLNSKKLYYLKFWSWCVINWKKFNICNIIYKPYKIWANLITYNEQQQKIFSWNSNVNFYFYYKNTKVCFKLNLSSWRLSKTICK